MGSIIKISFRNGTSYIKPRDWLMSKKIHVLDIFQEVSKLFKIMSQINGSRY